MKTFNRNLIALTVLAIVVLVVAALTLRGKIRQGFLGGSYEFDSKNSVGGSMLQGSRMTLDPNGKYSEGPLEGHWYYDEGYVVVDQMIDKRVNQAIPDSGKSSFLGKRGFLLFIVDNELNLHQLNITKAPRESFIIYKRI